MPNLVKQRVGGGSAGGGGTIYAKDGDWLDLYTDYAVSCCSTIALNQTTLAAEATALSNTITVADATEWRVGNGIAIPGADTAAAELLTTVDGVSGSVLTLADAIVTTVAIGGAVYHDDTVQILAGLVAANAAGKWAYLAAGYSTTSYETTFADGMALVGAGDAPEGYAWVVTNTGNNPTFTMLFYRNTTGICINHLGTPSTTNNMSIVIHPDVTAASGCVGLSCGAVSSPDWQAYSTAHMVTIELFYDNWQALRCWNTSWLTVRSYLAGQFGLYMNCSPGFNVQELDMETWNSGVAGVCVDDTDLCSWQRLACSLEKKGLWLRASTGSIRGLSIAQMLSDGTEGYAVIADGTASNPVRGVTISSLQFAMNNGTVGGGTTGIYLGQYSEGFTISGIGGLLGGQSPATLDGIQIYGDNHVISGVSLVSTVSVRHAILLGGTATGNMITCGAVSFNAGGGAWVTGVKVEAGCGANSLVGFNSSLAATGVNDLSGALVQAGNI